MSEAARIYFERRYPRRGLRIGGRLCRRGEQERLEVMRAWLPSCAGLDVLDAGCGDGVFLRRLLTERPARLRLEDFAARPLALARKELANHADVVEAELTDVTRAEHPHADFVLALGVFDYTTNWEGLLRRLLRRTRRALFADFPRAGGLHNTLRRCWLGVQGVRLHTTTRAELERKLAVLPGTHELRSLELHWMARITLSGPEPSHAS